MGVMFIILRINVHFEFGTSSIVIMTLDTVQDQNIEFESINVSSRTHGLCVGPKPMSHHKILCIWKYLPL